MANPTAAPTVPSASSVDAPTPVSIMEGEGGTTILGSTFFTGTWLMKTWAPKKSFPSPTALTPESISESAVEFDDSGAPADLGLAPALACWTL